MDSEFQTLIRYLCDPDAQLARAIRSDDVRDHVQYAIQMCKESFGQLGLREARPFTEDNVVVQALLKCIGNVKAAGNPQEDKAQVFLERAWIPLCQKALAAKTEGMQESPNDQPATASDKSDDLPVKPARRGEFKVSDSALESIARFINDAWPIGVGELGKDAGQDSATHSDTAGIETPRAAPSDAMEPTPTSAAAESYQEREDDKGSDSDKAAAVASHSC